MKTPYKPHLLMIFLFLVFTANAQNDTIVTLYDYQWMPTTKENAQFAGLKWKEGNVWKAQDYYWPENKLQMSGGYTDTSGKVKQGLFRFFSRTGIQKDSCYFIEGKKHGTQKEWYENGAPLSVAHYNNGIKVDTCIIWEESGKPYIIYTGDSLGNGIERLFADNGQVRCEGRYYMGKKTGVWKYKDQLGIPSADITYDGDSAIAVSCYDESGSLEKKTDCKLEIPASFKGGFDGWRRYLERNLRYPKISERNGTQGIVSMQFTVDKDGKPLDVVILSSPDENLAKEASRILRNSPNWVPAVQYNRKVTYRFVQTVTFRLQ